MVVVKAREELAGYETGVPRQIPRLVFETTADPKAESVQASCPEFTPDFPPPRGVQIGEIVGGTFDGRYIRHPSPLDMVAFAFLSIDPIVEWLKLYTLCNSFLVYSSAQLWLRPLFFGLRSFTFHSRLCPATEDLGQALTPGISAVFHCAG
jgi:hypothetical protein